MIFGSYSRQKACPARSNEQLVPNSQDGERRGTQQILQDIWLSILKRHPYVSMVYQVLYNSKLLQSV